MTGANLRPQVTQLDIAEEDDSYILMTGDPYTLISECPKFGCIAWVMNRRGEVLHTWEVDLGQLWADTPDHTGLKNHQDISVVGLHLYDNGDLIASFASKRMFPHRHRNGEVRQAWQLDMEEGEFQSSLVFCCSRWSDLYTCSSAGGKPAASWRY